MCDTFVLRKCAPTLLIILCCSYGLKAVNGVNRLSGDGLEAKDVPGMMQGGGKWPGRCVRNLQI